MVSVYRVPEETWSNPTMASPRPRKQTREEARLGQATTEHPKPKDVDADLYRHGDP